MTDGESRDLVARIAIEQKGISLRIKELSASQGKTDQLVKELGKQIGGLGEKFGSFNGGLALSSMQRILREKFNMKVVSPSVRVSKQGQHLEIDVLALAYANSDINQAYIVEVKSHAREEAIEQLRNILAHFFPGHKDKTLYGILVAVDMFAAIFKAKGY